MKKDEPVQSKLHTWLRKNGYPLEMKVAAAVRKHTDFDVRHSWHYQDPETGISREIDVVCTASEPRGIAEINFVIECKGTTKPWVLFTSEDAASSYHRLRAFGLLNDTAHVAIIDEVFQLNDSDFQKAKEIPWLWKDEMIGYAITQGFDGNKDIPYVGVLSSIKAALWLKKNSFWSNVESRKFGISFPIVVTSSPLFECHLDEKGEIILQPIDHGFLFFNQHIEDFMGTCVSIVNENYFESFIKECSEVSSSLYKALAPALEQEWNDLIRKPHNENT